MSFSFYLIYKSVYIALFASSRKEADVVAQLKGTQRKVLIGSNNIQGNYRHHIDVIPSGGEPFISTTSTFEEDRFMYVLGVLIFSTVCIYGFIIT